MAADKPSADVVLGVFGTLTAIAGGDQGSLDDLIGDLIEEHGNSELLRAFYVVMNGFVFKVSRLTGETPEQVLQRASLQIAEHYR